MLSFLIFLLSPFLAIAGVGNILPPQLQSTSSNANYSYSGGCWNPEPSVTVGVASADLDKVHNLTPAYKSQPACYGSGVPFNPPNGVLGNYVRVRQNLRMVKYKTDTEGAPFYGGCGLSGSAIRIIGELPDGRKIWWEDQNYTGGKLFDIIFVEEYPDDNDSRYFDVYAKDTIVNDPEGNGYGYLLECKSSGGIVPVVEESKSTLPPQTIAFRKTDGDKYGLSYLEKGQYLANYCRFTNNPIDCATSTQAPGTIGPTTPPTYRLFPDYKYYLIKIQMDETGVPSQAIPKGQIGRVTALDEKSVSHIFDVFFHAGTFYLRDQIDGTAYKYDASETPPPSSIDTNRSLQLGVLQFRVVDEWNPYIPVCKPAIYLYPEKEIELSVKVLPDGYLTSSIPEYNGGWSVRAWPDGRIEQCDNETMKQCNNYPYLYYEVNIANLDIPTEGWVIKKEDLGNFFDKTLRMLGLNNQEANDFKDYWVPKLAEKPYYFVTLLPVNEINEKEKLVFSQNPDTLIRVRFIFEGLDKPVTVKPLLLPQIPQRVGFVAVDWGGGVINGNCDLNSLKNQVIQ